MRTIFDKLKTSATLWSVIGGFVLGIANIIWGADSTATSISSAVMFSAPAVAYIISKFYLRIKLADVNNDGKVSLQELVAALSAASVETEDEVKDVVDILKPIIDGMVSTTQSEEESE